MTNLSKQDIQERIEKITEEIEDYFSLNQNFANILPVRGKVKQEMFSLISDVVKEVIGEEDESETYFGISNENTKILEYGKHMDHIRNQLRSEQEAKRKELLGD